MRELCRDAVHPVMVTGSAGLFKVGDVGFGEFHPFFPDADRTAHHVKGEAPAVTEPQAPRPADFGLDPPVGAVGLESIGPVVGIHLATSRVWHLPGD
ncbi:MAG: hypothetical protein WBZ04_00875 [Candidatus Nanopelagicales bacterium]